MHNHDADRRPKNSHCCGRRTTLERCLIPGLIIATLLLISSVITLIVIHRNSKTNEYDDDQVVSLCITSECVQVASDVLKSMDPSIDPCDDFYKFVCGNYIKTTTIPDDQHFTMSFTSIDNKVTEQIRKALEKPAYYNETRPLTLAKDYYKLCMDVATIDHEALDSAKSILSELGGWPLLEGSLWKADDFDWTTLIYKLVKKGFSSKGILVAAVGINTKNTSQSMFTIDQANLESERSFLLEGLKNQIVKEFYEMLVDVAVIFGANEILARNELIDVLEFKMEIAKICLPSEERRNFTVLTNHMTLSEMQLKYPQISWLKFVNNILSIANVSMNKDDIVDVTVPKYISDLIQLIHRTPKRTQANYMLTETVVAMFPYLTKDVRKRFFKFQKTVLGTASQNSRWKECVESVKLELRIATSALYTRTYVQKKTKEDATELVKNLHEAFRTVLTQTDWMDSETKSEALEKADAMVAYVAYPDELLDDELIEQYYAKLSLQPSFLESSLSINRFSRYKAFNRLHKPRDKADWTVYSDATSVNAFYTVEENGIILPAGILQGIFFDERRPHYMNYGAIGYLIGHEITHGFDDIGRQFNKNGDMKEWWRQETKQKYLDKAQCIIEQYSNYTVEEVNLNLNGINTQGENIADNGGIMEAYLAYNKWVEKNGHEEDYLPGLDYTPKQMFWISSANLWCTKVRDEYLQVQVLVDTHSPSYYRVIGALSNSKYFAQDFNCPLGSRMNPEHKCQVW